VDREGCNYSIAVFIKKQCEKVIEPFGDQNHTKRRDDLCESGSARSAVFLRRSRSLVLALTVMSFVSAAVCTIVSRV
jgi:hypothetical protein